METGIFAAGCFWKPDLEFEKLRGVKRTEVGYCGGNNQNTTYENVCTGTTNHAEVVKVYYDENIISYEELVKFFFKIHNPTTLNRQGPDIGTQYRSGIFFHDEEQERIALDNIHKLNPLAKEKFGSEIVTKVLPASKFFRAEEYHQKYFQKMG